MRGRIVLFFISKILACLFCYSLQRLLGNYSKVLGILQCGDEDQQHCSRNVVINIQSDSIVRQTSKVHRLTYTTMNKNHIFYYNITKCFKFFMNFIIAIRMQ